MNKSIKLIFNYFLAPLLFILLSWSLYRQIVHQQDLPERWAHIRNSWSDPVFWIIFFLMFLNWGIESLKWKISLRPLENLSFANAFRSVLSGCSITMLTPNRIGEYGGRILYLKEENRLTAISVNILGSISQLMVTLLLGTIALVVLKESSLSVMPAIREATPWMIGNVLLLIGLCSFLFLLLIYFKVDSVVHLVARLPYSEKVVKHLHVLAGFERKLLLRIFILSFLRYMIFILQYVLMLNVMDVHINTADCFLLIAVFYLVMAIAPTAGFVELPIRALASVQIFGLFSNNILGIQAAAMAIWMINLVVPAIIGSILIFGIKILKEK